MEINIRFEFDEVEHCRKCRVIVEEQDTVNKVTKIERKNLSKSEIDFGYRLARKTEVFKNAFIMIP